MWSNVFFSPLLLDLINAVLINSKKSFSNYHNLRVIFVVPVFSIPSPTQPFEATKNARVGAQKFPGHGDTHQADGEDQHPEHESFAVPPRKQRSGIFCSLAFSNDLVGERRDH